MWLSCSWECLKQPRVDGERCATPARAAAKETTFEGNLLRFVRARVHLRVLMTQKSFAVGMRNAIPGNHLKR